MRGILAEIPVAPPTVSGLLSRMEQKGFIRYEADTGSPSETDRVDRTSALAVHEQILERIHATNALATANLTEDEVATLHRLLDQVYANLTAASTENGKGPCLCMDESFEKMEICKIQDRKECL